MQRTWLEVGRAYTSGKDRDGGHRRHRGAGVALSNGRGSAVPGTHAAGRGERTGPTQGLGAGLGWGEANVFEYPDGPETAAYSVLGVEANYADGRMRLYVLDTGVAAVPLASDFPVPVPARSAEGEEPAIERFSIGAVVATPGAIERMECHGIDERQLLARHGAGDWGDIDPRTSPSTRRRFAAEAVAVGLWRRDRQ